MSAIFDTYLKAKDASFKQGQNAFAMDQYIRKVQQDQKLRNVLSSAYSQPVPALPGGPGVGPTMPGETLPPVPPQAAQPGGFDYDRAIGSMASSGLAPEALALQQQRSAANAPLQKLLFEHKLKQQDRDAMFKQFQGMMGGGNVQPGYTTKITPKGPELSYDPTVAPKLSMEQARMFFETGMNPLAASQGTPSQSAPAGGGLSPKSQQELEKLKQEESIKAEQARKSTLSESSANRQAFLEKANKFKRLISGKDLKEGETKMSTGGWRKFAQEWIPGVYTKQGELSEEFNSFAEVAARAALKANGEIRPTDADVKGMKEAMFGVGRDENVNIILLDDAIRQIESDNTELQSIEGGTKQTQRTPSSAENKQALKWANENPNDPRAMQILKKLGAQ